MDFFYLRNKSMIFMVVSLRHVLLVIHIYIYIKLKKYAFFIIILYYISPLFDSPYNTFFILRKIRFIT